MSYVTFPMTFPIFMCTLSFLKLRANRTSVSHEVVVLSSERFGLSVKVDSHELTPRPMSFSFGCLKSLVAIDGDFSGTNLFLKIEKKKRQQIQNRARKCSVLNVKTPCVFLPVFTRF